MTTRTDWVAPATKLIKEFEGCILTAYADPASPLGIEMRKKPAARVAGWEKLSGAPWTIGYGQTGPDIVPGIKWTQQQAEDRLVAEVAHFGEQVIKIVPKSCNANQLAALVCFAFNVGIQGLRKSTLLKKLNAGDVPGAALEFMKWNKAGGKAMAGLTRRRQAEMDLFNDTNTPCVVF
jgi:lysozyme